MVADWFDNPRPPKSPVTALGAVTTDNAKPVDLKYGIWHTDYRPADRYPDPTTAELVTLWKRNGRVVMSITADGKTQDFHLPPARLVVLLREIAEQLAESTILQ